MRTSTILQGLLSACLLGSSYGQDRMSLFLRNGIGSRLSGTAEPVDPDVFGSGSTESFGPCVTPIGAGKCLSQADAFFNYCRKNNVSAEDCQASVAKLEEAVGMDYDSEGGNCFALFPGVGMSKADLEGYCPGADEVAFYYPETSGFPVDGNSAVGGFDCFKCTRG